jgi:hypothetical protein
MKSVGVILIILAFSFFILPVYAQTTKETITLTTYYPAPYGVYKELRVQRMAIGDNYINSNYAWDPLAVHPIDSNADLIVEGNVGIGTTTPNYKLDLLNTTPGNVNFLLQLDRVDAASYESVMEFATNDQMQWWFGMDNDGTNKLHIGNQGTIHRQTWYQNGNVGIGVYDPQAKLDVAGGVKVGSDTRACTAAIAGTVRYNAGALEYCDGSATPPTWKNTTAGASGVPKYGTYKGWNGKVTGSGETITVNLGFRPQVVVIFGTWTVFKTKDMANGDTQVLAFSSGDFKWLSGMVYLTSTGFEIRGGINVYTNYNYLTTYAYLAW